MRLTSEGRLANDEERYPVLTTLPSDALKGRQRTTLDGIRVLDSGKVEMGLVTDEGEWSPVLFGHPELNVIQSAGEDSGYDPQDVEGTLGKVDYLNSTLLAIDRSSWPTSSASQP